MPKVDTPIGVLTWSGKLSEQTLITMPDGSQRNFYSIISHTNGEALQWFVDKNKNVKTSIDHLVKAGRNVIGEALTRLDEIPKQGDHMKVPWPITKRPKLDPEQWEDSTIETVPIADLYATQDLLTTERVRFYVKNPGAMEEGRRAFANVYDRDGKLAIVDGHHRLAALWLLGADDALVWMLRDEAE